MNLNNYIKDARVCLLCCGESLDKYNINYSFYDIICGTNRIYKTNHFSYINILFDGSHYLYDPLNDNKIDILNNSLTLKYIVFSCGSMAFRSIELSRSRLIKNNTLKYRNTINNKKISIGTEAFLSILDCSPESLEVFGLDFHQTRYTKELQKDKSHETNAHLLHDYQYEKSLCYKIIDESKNKIKLNF